MSSAENRQKRLAIWNPAKTEKRLSDAERRLVKACMKQSARQWEAIRIQLSMGVSLDYLILDAKATLATSEIIAQSLVSTQRTARRIVRAEITQAIAEHEGVKFAAEKIPPEPPPEPPPDTPLNRGIAWYRKYTLKLVKVYDDDTLQAVKAEIIKGLSQGQTVREMMKGIEQAHEGFTRHRLENIARTETMKVYNQTRYREMVGSEAVVAYEISAVMDSRTCPICIPRDGKVISLDKANGQLPPWHCMCRCLSTAVFSWELESGKISLKNIPKSAPPVQDGFGTTSMKITSIRR